MCAPSRSFGFDSCGLYTPYFIILRPNSKLNDTGSNQSKFKWGEFGVRTHPMNRSELRTCSSKSRHCFRHSSWLLRSVRFKPTWPVRNIDQPTIGIMKMEAWNMWKDERVRRDGAVTGLGPQQRLLGFRPQHLDCKINRITARCEIIARRVQCKIIGDPLCGI